MMDFCYRGVHYNDQSAVSSSSASGNILKYRGVSYYHQSLNLAQELSNKKLTYRGVSYYKDGSQPVKLTKAIPTLKSALT